MSSVNKKVANAKADVKRDVNSVLEIVKQEAKLSKRYYRTFLFVCGSIFLLNGLLLYFGTLCGYETNFFCVDLARFYGFREGRNTHLQRSAGLMCLIIATLNFAGIIYSDHLGVLLLSAVSNLFVVVHYSLETTYFQDIRIEFLFLFGFFLLMNLIWTFREVHKARTKVVVVNK
ncbi:hypothetical protein AKO1_004917 [Acrasis kona]|uniref:PRA1 family protein n=1 Tax=Acrasis kona TaxID=1008807 RepID=A0AAW2Z3V9_9EUKA